MAPLVAKESVEYWLYDAPGEVAGNISLQYRDELDLLYRKRDHQLIWMDHFQLTDAGLALIKMLKHTASDEWKAYRFRISKLQNEVKYLSNEPKHAAAIDVLLSDAYIDFASQVFNKELLCLWFNVGMSLGKLNLEPGKQQHSASEFCKVSMQTY